VKKIPLALAAVTLLSACTAAPRIAATVASSPVATSATAADGCAQATAAVLAARKRINAQDYAGAVTRISDLRDTAHGKVAIDAVIAATDLAFLRYDATAGNPVGKDLTDSLAALDKIDADCAP
jgi:hypothetical protein